MDDIKKKLETLWNGDVPLAQTFWLYYFVAMVVLGFLGKVVGPVMGVVSLGWAGFMVMPIMRSADKFEGNSLFALLAKIAAVLLAIGVIASIL